ncbi:12188_t:CDS:1, partial [Funneliformis geosporum]
KYVSGKKMNNKRSLIVANVAINQNSDLQLMYWVRNPPIGGPITGPMKNPR